jgi:hypothetical protein
MTNRMNVLVITGALACSTLAETAGGDQNLPSAGGGPFRKLQGAEVHGTAPYLLDDATADYRQPTVLPLGGTELALYFVMHDKTSGVYVIARSHALDGRSFYGATQDLGHSPKLVLASDQPWEAPDLSHPSAVATAGGVWLYYTSNGSVGLARSTDGFSFTKASAPVLGGGVDSASVAELPDGTFRMMFAQNGSIYEASSTDGATWKREGTDPVLAPAPPFDTLAVVDPCLVPRVTAAGRLHIRVLYTGLAPDGDASVPASTIGFAARYGEETTALDRSTSAAYAIGKHERSPALFEWDAGSFLYVDQDPSSLSANNYRAIAAGVSPPQITLALPSAYPDSP